MKLKTLKQLGALLDFPLAVNGSILDVAVDSRLVKKDTVFFALPGLKTDGHDFLGQAVMNGASCLVVKKNYTGPNFGKPLIFVDDPLKSLQDLSTKLLAMRTSKIIAITGSVGKTTTKDFLTTLLKEKFIVSKTIGNANSQTGVPLTILNHTDGNEDFLVVEMGMDKPGQIAKLVASCPPDFAILTQVALAHACNFESLKEIAFEKAEIFQHPKTEFCLINQEIEHFNDIVNLGSCKKYSFSTKNSGVDFYFNNFNISKERLNFANHHYQNLTAALGLATLLGVTEEEINNALHKLALPERRFEIVEKQGITFINDSYNASEISIVAALEALPAKAEGRKRVAVIAEMLELGKFSVNCHLNVAKKALKHVDSMFLLGKECLPIFDYWKENNKCVEFFLDRSLLVKSLKENLVAGDICLLKGSSANQLWKILEEF